MPSDRLAAWRRASSAFAPTAHNAVPLEGDFPSLPSGRMNRSFGVNRTSSACFQASRNHGALVRSGVNAIPFPCLKNLVSHGSSPLRPPNGGFIQTKPDHSACKLSAERNEVAGTCVVPVAGEATSISKWQPSASNTCLGVYHSSLRPFVSQYPIADDVQANEIIVDQHELHSFSPVGIMLGQVSCSLRTIA